MIGRVPGIATMISTRDSTMDTRPGAIDIVMKMRIAGTNEAHSIETIVVLAAEMTTVTGSTAAAIDTMAENRPMDATKDVILPVAILGTPVLIAQYPYVLPPLNRPPQLRDRRLLLPLLLPTLSQ